MPTRRFSLPGHMQYVLFFCGMQVVIAFVGIAGKKKNGAKRVCRSQHALFLSFPGRLVRRLPYTYGFAKVLPIFTEAEVVIKFQRGYF